MLSELPVTVYIMFFMNNKRLCSFLFADVRGKYAVVVSEVWVRLTLETAQCFISLPILALLLLKWLLI